MFPWVGGGENDTNLGPSSSLWWNTVTGCQLKHGSSKELEGGNTLLELETQEAAGGFIGVQTGEGTQEAGNRKWRNYPVQDQVLRYSPVFPVFAALEE